MTSESNSKCQCAKMIRYCKVAFAIVAVVVSVFDLCTDWYSFSVFVRNDGEDLAIAYSVVCAVGSVLLAFEIHNAVMAYRVYTRETPETIVAGAGGLVVKDRRWERKLELWQEVVSFLLLFLEDFPTIVIMYMTFKTGNCRLYSSVFQLSFTANLALLGTLVSSVWKGVLSFRYCCTCEYRNVKGGCCVKSCCCCCRTIRPIVAITLITLVGILYNAFNTEVDPRDDCLGYGLNATSSAP